MPRVYDEERNPSDLCRICFRKSKFPEAYEIDAEHPEYSETEYKCDYCGKKLQDKDNWEIK